MSTDAAPGWAQHDLGRVLVTAQAIRTRVAELGAEITRDYQDSPPLLVGVLKGAMMFMSDLMRAIELPSTSISWPSPPTVQRRVPSGVVRIVKDLDADLAGRHVIVVEDIVDSGLTLSYLRKYLGARGPLSLEVCALLDKQTSARVEQNIRYVGFPIPDAFVVGYGLDVSERYRNLDGVYEFVGSAS
jgi:hypoxanthine phosphoribosyltransferase